MDRVRTMVHSVEHNSGNEKRAREDHQCCASKLHLDQYDLRCINLCASTEIDREKVEVGPWLIACIVGPKACQRIAKKSNVAEQKTGRCEHRKNVSDECTSQRFPSAAH